MINEIFLNLLKQQNIDLLLNEPMSKHTTFKIGGIADIFIKVEKVEVTRVGKTRRAKLYYLRDRVGKAAKTKEKIGARIETNEIVVKEEIVPGEADTVEEVTDVVPEEVATTEEVNETPVVEEKKEEAVLEENKEEVKAEEKAEKAVTEENEEKKTETTTEDDKKDAE